jgi:acetyltransferase-like isoleucine patch superfamily enzyme
MKKISFFLSVIRGWILYYFFFKKCTLKFYIKNPILITPKYISLGDKVQIRDHARIEGVNSYAGDFFTPDIQIGDNVTIEQNLHLTCAKLVKIGSNTSIAANVTITDINHGFEDINIPPERQNLIVNEVEIGENCKIYNNAVILPGVRLGRHNIVGANSVVRGSFPDYCVIAGAPARIVKKYNFATQTWEKVK